jgi:hypothetical protein
MIRRAGASEYRSAIIATHPAPPRQAATDAWINPHGVSCASSLLDNSNVRHPGYFVHLTPRRTSLPTAGALWVAAHVLLALPGPAWAPCFARESEILVICVYLFGPVFNEANEPSSTCRLRFQR